MTNLWFDDLEERGQGGRAYKVINKDDMTYFDVREDQIERCILHHGISKGGHLGGEWVFAMAHSQCKAVLIDSPEYIEALAKDARPIEQKTKMSMKALKVGNIYTDKNVHCEWIYVGFLPNKICTKDAEYTSSPFGYSFNYTRTLISAAEYALKNKHTFITKRDFYNKNSQGVSIPGFMFENPSTVYPTDKSLTIAEIQDILKGQHGYEGSHQWEGFDAELKERAEASINAL